MPVINELMKLNQEYEKTKSIAAHDELCDAVHRLLPALASEWAEMERKVRSYEDSPTQQEFEHLKQQLAERDREIESLKHELRSRINCGDCMVEFTCVFHQYDRDRLNLYKDEP